MPDESKSNKNEKINLSSFATKFGPLESIVKFLQKEELTNLSQASTGFFHATRGARVHIKRQTLIELFNLFKQLAFFLIDNKAEIDAKKPKRLCEVVSRLNYDLMEKVNDLNLAIGDTVTLIVGKLNMLLAVIKNPLIDYLNNTIEIDFTKEEFYKKCVAVAVLIKNFRFEGYLTEIALWPYILTAIEKLQNRFNKHFDHLFRQGLTEELDLYSLVHLLSLGVNINDRLITVYRYADYIPLQFAIRNANKKMTLFCLENKAEITDWTLYAIFSNFNTEIFAIFLDISRDVNSRISLCSEALNRVNLDALKMIHDKFPLLIQQALDMPSKDGCFHKGDIHILFVEFLLNFKINKDKYDKLLFQAASKHNPAVLKLLLKHNHQTNHYKLDLSACLMEAHRVAHNLNYYDRPLLVKLFNTKDEAEKNYEEVTKLLQNPELVSTDVQSSVQLRQ